MRIGILTFHCAHNYGAVLQCYALQEFLKSKGHNVEIIDYRPYYLLRPYKIFKIERILSHNPIKLLKNTFRELALLYYRYVRYYNFETFITNKLNLSLRVRENNIPNKYDIYIIGSDQVWNPKITKGFDNIYFASFPFEKEKKKYISYAASMGVQELTAEQKQYIKSSLCNFDKISVRENNLCKLLEPLTSNTINQVIDPTLLIKVADWNQLVIKPNINSKYVLVYQVRTNKETLKIANNIARQIGGVVIEAVAWLNIRCFKNKYQVATPEAFLGLIKYADCVVTTSFHGTAFSIIFNKVFYTLLLNDGKDSRSLSLLESVGLKDRAISINSTISFTSIDYSEVNYRLNQIRKDSEKYLDLSHERS